MIIWLNGPFGVGKTQTALELRHQLEDSFVCDPEELGFPLRKVVPFQSGQDFQDLVLWRKFTYATLEYLNTSSVSFVIVPMTLVNDTYFEEIIGQLRKQGVVIYHFALLADKDTILQRLHTRGDDVDSWPAQQIDRCLTALESSQFAKHIDTRSLTIQQVSRLIINEIKSFIS